MGILWVELV